MDAVEEYARQWIQREGDIVRVEESCAFYNVESYESSK